MNHHSREAEVTKDTNNFDMQKQIDEADLKILSVSESLFINSD